MELTIVIPIIVIGLLVGIASGMRIAFVLLTVGLVAYIVASGLEGLRFVGSVPWSKAATFTILAIPLFVLMGLLLAEAGVVAKLFRMLTAWTGQVPGTINIATLAAGTGFAAMCGSASAATAALGKTVIPEVRRYKYHPGVSAGVVIGGASLAPLIPPSIAMIIY